MKTQNETPAFPVTFREGGEVIVNAGMSLRDWFAGQALNGLLSGDLLTDDAERIVAAAYWTADAMLKEREKNSSYANVPDDQLPLASGTKACSAGDVPEVPEAW